MTNGEMIKTIFPNEEMYEQTPTMTYYGMMRFDTEWWNAEYKEPTTKNDLGVDAVSRQFMYELGATCIATRNKKTGHLMALGMIEELPSVTSQEPKTGKWISTETKGVRYAFWCRYKCSLCGGLSDHTNFCPNCGAKMESEDKE